MLDRADDIEVVDLTPDDLIQRLKEGKVYVRAAGRARAPALFLARQPDRAARTGAAPHRPARRRADGRLHARARHRRPWAAGERVLVCIGDGAGRRRAGALRAAAGRPAARALDGAPCRDRARPAALSEAERDRIAEALRLAERLGGEAVTDPRPGRRRRPCSPMPRPTTSPTSSSARRGGRAGSSCCTARSPQRIIRAGRRHQRPRHRRPPPRAKRGRAAGRAACRAGARHACCALRRQLGGGRRRRAGVGAGPARNARHLERRAGVPDRGAGQRRHARACGRRCWPVCSQRARPTISSSCRRSTPSPSPIRPMSSRCSSSLVVALIASNLAARVRAQAIVARAARARPPRSSISSAASSPASARSTTALGDRASDRADAEGARGPAAAAKATGSRCAPAIRRRTSSTRPTSPPRNGPGTTTAPPAAAPTRCRAPSGCSCRCSTGRGAGRRRSASTATSRARCCRPSSAPARRAGRPGRARRSSASISAHDVDQARLRRRDRPAALGAADLDLARSAHAAGLDPRRRDQPAPASAQRAGRRDAGRTCCATIQEEAERLNRFIGNLLDMTRLEAGAVQPDRRSRRSVRHRRRALRARRAASSPPTASRSNSRPTCRCWRSTPCCSSRCCSTCSTTPRNMRPPGSPIAAARAARRASRSCSQVLDEGDGIRRADLERVFDKFYRVHAGDRQRAGTGLGPRDLPRLRRGDGRHDHGRATAPTARGAVFTIKLPVPAASPGQSADGERGVSTAPLGTRALRVLVVDDEPAIRRFLRTRLAAQGYVVTEASEGAAAVQAAQRHAADVIVLDLGLPDIDGLEVIRRIRGAGLGRADHRAVEPRRRGGKVEALDLGADDYVTKPFGIDELLARIRAALRHQLQQQGERPVFRSGDLTVDLVRRIVHGARAGGEALAARIRSAAPARGPCRQGADAQVHLCAKSGAEIPTCNICASTSGHCARRSRPIPSGPSTSSPKPGWAIVSQRRTEPAWR